MYRRQDRASGHVGRVCGQAVLPSCAPGRKRSLLFTCGFQCVYAPGNQREEAEALIASIDSIEPAICTDTRFNHVDAFYKELFKQHSCEALVAIVKGLKGRMSEKKTKSSRAESTMKRARDMLHGELSIALGIDFKDVEEYICARCGKL